MDINELLLDAKLPQLRIDVKEKYEEFQSVCSTLIKLTSNTIKPMAEAFLKQSKEFFNQYGFNTLTNDINIVNFENELSNIKIEFLPDEEIISFSLAKKDSQNIYRNVKIQPEFTKEDMMYWKVNINELVSLKSVSEVLEEISDANKLKKILSDIKINIMWYSETIEKFDDIKFIYADAHSEENIEYKNFEDFFNKI